MVETTMSRKQTNMGLNGRKPQFRDHIWAYAQMYRAESSMAFVSGGDCLEVGDDLVAKRGEGVELVQQLFAGAEAVACRDARQAAAIIQDLAYLVSPYGSSLQRVSTCFIQGLLARLALLIHPNDHNYKQQLQLALPVNNIKEPCYKDKEEALRLVYEICPYIPFGHYAANAAIMEAFEGEDYVHVVDLGMTSGLARGLQWCGLIRDLAARPSGVPKLVRITGIGVSAAAMTEIGAHIKEQAEGLNVALEFQAVEISLEKMTPSMIDINEGEAVAVNSVLELHCVVKESRGSLNSVLQAIHKLRPRVLTLVEQDASHNGPFFLGRFIEALYYYSAIFDSLDATLPRPSTQRDVDMHVGVLVLPHFEYNSSLDHDECMVDMIFSFKHDGPFSLRWIWDPGIVLQLLEGKKFQEGRLCNIPFWAKLVKFGILGIRFWRWSSPQLFDG